MVHVSYFNFTKMVHVSYISDELAFSFFIRVSHTSYTHTYVYIYTSSSKIFINFYKFTLSLLWLGWHPQKPFLT